MIEAAHPFFRAGKARLRILLLARTLVFAREAPSSWSNFGMEEKVSAFTMLVAVPASEAFTDRSGTRTTRIDR
jgi:hypothetical protein